MQATVSNSAKASVKRQHSMPFGAQILSDGRVRFRLWAPAAERVDVCLQHRTNSDASQQETKQAILPMTAEPEGWFSLITDQASVGSRYLFRIDEDMQVPDPASRYQPQDVHGPSEVIDPGNWEWQDTSWRGRPWEETVVYELHVGSFTSQGDFASIADKLDHLLELGVTALELMPVADFPGARNWGYDGTYLFAPDSRYGRPDDLKALINTAHNRGLMVFLDVVYNHFGPEGNYLHVYAPRFFTQRHKTPWGAAINYDGEDSHWIREFFIHNALYWLEEYHLDGLRFDAVHAIVDDSRPDILTELAERVRQHIDAARSIHLILENDHNAAHYLSRESAAQPRWYDAQWNDDIHHTLHVLLTGEVRGYYMDYADNPLHQLGRCLTEGFAYQGDESAYRDHQRRGEASAHLPATAFVSFLQNHDQIGNRAFGERITRLADTEPVRAALTVLLLAPSPPLLFMGQEWGSHQPFPFFCDFGGELAEQVVAGRRGEFARFPEFSDPASRERIPNPMDESTFELAVLDWTACTQAQHRHWLDLHRELLNLRQREIVPRIRHLKNQPKDFSLLSEQVLAAHWILADGSHLRMWANFGETVCDGLDIPTDHILYSTHTDQRDSLKSGKLPPWAVIWSLHPEDT